MFDVVIIGGSYSGMSAALPLVRARRRVLIVDAGKPRNRFASHSHGFLTRDGTPPAAIADEARRQLMAYPTVEWREGRVESVRGAADDFSVTLSDGRDVCAHRIILAAGVSDELPEVPGLAEQWGRNVFHCPYCHGYELGKSGIGVLASSELALHHGLMLPDWGETTLFLNDTFEPDADQLTQLAERGTRVERGKVARVQDPGRDTGDVNAGLELVMQDGRVFGLSGLFVQPRLRLGSLVTRIGCELEETPLGRVIKTDGTQATTIPGIFACGDIARAAGSVTLAVGDGAMAGLSAHRSLIFGL